ncbi:MAG: shikimate dehydrogenase [Candidatus Omnitrophota bacterium]|nr:MAG: shikimate dehydrogenase [Candidatus Omnitrophota bacterium]
MSPSKKIYGLIGYPVKHSLSPAMHNAAFKATGIDAQYRLFEVKPEELRDFLINRKDVVGFNITIPHKIKAREICEKEDASLDSFVKMTGAVNTVKRAKENLKCFNTDAPGFAKSLKEELGFEARDKKALLLGCGGAGRAVIAGLTSSEIDKIYIYEKSKEVIQAAQKHFSASGGVKDKIEFIEESQLKNIIQQCQLLVNATPLGMKGNDPSPIDKNLLHKGLYVYDVVYNRNKDTQLIQDAKSLGLKFASGLDMLLYQGVLAWEYWTGKDAPLEVMRKALKEAARK